MGSSRDLLMGRLMVRSLRNFGRRPVQFVHKPVGEKKTWRGEAATERLLAGEVTPHPSAG
jgi:hypothetical protein